MTTLSDDPVAYAVAYTEQLANTLEAPNAGVVTMMLLTEAIHHIDVGEHDRAAALVASATNVANHWRTTMTNTAGDLRGGASTRTEE